MRNMRASRTSWQIEPFKEGVPLSYRAAFNGEQFAILMEGHIPQQMEDHWFIYYEEPYLCMHRSWTGTPVYRLTLKSLPGGAEIQADAHRLCGEVGAANADYDSLAQMMSGQCDQRQSQENQPSE